MKLRTPIYFRICRVVFCALVGVFAYIISFPAALSFVTRHPNCDSLFDRFYAPLPELWRRQVIRLWMDEVDVVTWRMWIRQDPLDEP
jgi:hypothetical protein